MAPAYKLIYFASRGIAETSRFLLKYGGIEFEDVRITLEEWPQSQWKNKTPFGVVPVLEHNGKQVDQSNAIARYIAKQVKLAGNDDWEDLEIDAIVETVTDLFLKLHRVFTEKNETIKENLLETALKETIPYYLSKLENVVEKNDGFMALGRLTWADFHFAHISTFFDYVVEKELLDEYPKLKQVRARVFDLPAIKKWIEIRPDINFYNLAK